MVDVRTVGAGGGSIAWVNAAGMLQVGPELAGSSPGPICYGRGGTRPTITDAHLLLGRLDPAGLNAVDRQASIEPVRRGVRGGDRSARSGSRRKMRRRRSIRLADTHMAGAIRMVSLSRGYDPRDFVLFAFGGAGPLHAVAIARELGIAGGGGAGACRASPMRSAASSPTSARTSSTPSTRRSTARHAGGRRDASRAASRGRAASMRPSRTRSSRRVVMHGADMQFRGQTHLIRIAIPSPDVIPRRAAGAVRGGLFPRASRFGCRKFAQSLVNLVTSVIGRRRSLPVAALAGGGPDGSYREGRRPIYVDGAWREAQRFRPPESCAGRADRRARHHPAVRCDDGDRAGRGRRPSMRSATCASE